MAQLKPNTEKTGSFDLTGLTYDDLDMIQVGLIELQAKLKKEDAFHQDLKHLNKLFHSIDSELVSEQA